MEKFKYLGAVERHTPAGLRVWLYFQGFFAPDLIEVRADDIDDDTIDFISQFYDFTDDETVSMIAERGKRIGYIDYECTQKSKYIQELDICYIPIEGVE